MAPTRRNFGKAKSGTQKQRSPGAKKRQMTKTKMGIILGSVAAAVAAAVAIGANRKQLEIIFKKQFDIGGANFKSTGKKVTAES